MTLRTLALVSVLAIASAAAAAAPAKKKDVPGSADHPLAGRHADAWIAAYRAADFDVYDLVTAPVARPGESVLRLEGRVTKIAYHAPAEVSPLELYRNWQQKLAESGFETIFECADTAGCGRGFSRTLPILPTPAMFHGSRYHYFAGKKENVYATLYCEAFGGSKKNACQVSVVEVKPMAEKMIDAAGMASAIAERGAVALYGIYFDHDRAEMKAESKPTLAEIAALLAAEKDLEIVVVGHTDNQGSLDYNMDLSRRRAESVKAALVRDHGVAAARLEAWGAGYLAPVASNRSETGRAKNRRVELVER